MLCFLCLCFLFSCCTDRREELCAEMETADILLKIHVLLAVEFGYMASEMTVFDAYTQNGYLLTRSAV